MRTILVPLDGSETAEAIIPDALRFAGPDGQIVLMTELSHPVDSAVDRSFDDTIKHGEAYLEQMEAALRGEGHTVRSLPMALPDPVLAIDEAARLSDVDGIAIATHGRRPIARLVYGGVAWKALAHSVVPVMLRHVDTLHRSARSTDKKPRLILVPLDGSDYSESALPLAEDLAHEWHASLYLTRVVPTFAPSASPYGDGMIAADSHEEDLLAAQDYLDEIAGRFSIPVHAQAVIGPVVDRLVDIIESAAITDVVMASHGRTGVSRMILGSVADHLVHEVGVPVIVIPALAPHYHEFGADRSHRSTADAEVVAR